MNIFFAKYYVNHQNLHSFPTRRSSDLQGGRASPEQREWLANLAAQGWRAELCVGWAAAWDVLCDYLGMKQEGRSEEHTSELQSRRDLVCRLLLEKKKKKNIITNIHTTF